MATPPSRGIGFPWILREDSPWSRTPNRCASRRIRGVRTVPHKTDKTNATAAVRILDYSRKSLEIFHGYAKKPSDLSVTQQNAGGRLFPFRDHRHTDVRSASLPSRSGGLGARA